MISKTLLARLAALEARKVARAADKPPAPIPFGRLWLACIGRSKAPSGSILDGYAKACRYKGGTAALRAAAYGNPRAFARRHGKHPGEPEDVRLAVIEEFVIEDSGIVAVAAPPDTAALDSIERILARCERLRERMSQAARAEAAVRVMRSAEVAVRVEAAVEAADGLLPQPLLERLQQALSAPPVPVTDAARARQDDWVRAGIVIGPDCRCH